MSVFVFVFISNKGLCSVFTEHHRKHHMRKGWDTLQKSLIEFLQGIKSLLLVPTDPNTKHLCLSSSIHKWLLFSFMVDFRKLFFSFCICRF